MNTEQFWKLIALINTTALDDGYEDAAVAPLQEALRKYKPEKLEAFEEQLSVALHAIDGRLYALNAGDSGDSDDGFLYARCYVVAKGLAYYVSVLANPKLMPNSIDQWCEALLYPHRKAWAEVTGKDESEWIFDASVSYESGSNESLWKE